MAYWACVIPADDGDFVASIVTKDPGGAPGNWIKCTKTTKVFDKYSSSTKKNDVNRWALILGYARWWIKPSFDFIKNTPKNIFSKLNTSQKRLLGFHLTPPKDEFTRVRRIWPAPARHHR